MDGQVRALVGDFAKLAARTAAELAQVHIWPRSCLGDMVTHSLTHHLWPWSCLGVMVTHSLIPSLVLVTVLSGRIYSLTHSLARAGCGAAAHRRRRARARAAGALLLWPVVAACCCGGGPLMLWRGADGSRAAGAGEGPPGARALNRAGARYSRDTAEIRPRYSRDTREIRPRYTGAAEDVDELCLRG